MHQSALRRRNPNPCGLSILAVRRYWRLPGLGAKCESDDKCLRSRSARVCPGLFENQTEVLVVSFCAEIMWFCRVANNSLGAVSDGVDCFGDSWLQCADAFLGTCLGSTPVPSTCLPFALCKVQQTSDVGGKSYHGGAVSYHAWRPPVFRHD